MDFSGTFLTDLTIFGIVAGCYLLIRGFRAMKAVPDLDARGGRGLSAPEALKIAEAVIYAFMGLWFEAVSLSNAVFAHGLVWGAAHGF